MYLQLNWYYLPKVIVPVISSSPLSPQCTLQCSLQQRTELFRQLSVKGAPWQPSGEGNGIPLQYTCLGNPMDGGASVHGVAKSRTQLSDFTFTFHFHALEKEMATHSSALAWRIPGKGNLAGCRLWGRTESDMTEAT